MNSATTSSGLRRSAGYAIFVVTLIMALTGIANSAPAFWIIPPLGPFPSEIIRPIILAASVFVVILRSPFTDVVGERWPGLRSLGLAIDIDIFN